MSPKRPSGMTGFTIVWFGQVISLIGSSMTGFALSIWAFDKSGGQATPLALVNFFGFLPQILFAPLAGALVDRWNRKLTMMISDLAAAMTTGIMLILLTAQSLEIWHLYVLGFFAGTFQTFQWPAYSSAISTMIPKEHYTRASAMMGLAETGSVILAPIFAGALMGGLGVASGLPVIIAIDLATFCFAICALIIIFVPQPKETAEGKESRGSLLKESLFGFKYIWNRRPLLGLQMVFFFGNFFSTLGFTLLAPFILLRSGNNELVLGSVMSAAGIGGVIGGILMSAWGGFKKRKVNGVLLGWILSGAGILIMGAGRVLIVWIIAAVLDMLVMPLINSSNQAIWMSKVPADLQGRVFSIRRLIAQIVAPLAMLVAGPLADKVFEPGMATTGSALAPIFSWATGTGPGAGIGMIMILCSLLIIVIGFIGYMIPNIRNVETIIPDQIQSPEEKPATENIHDPDVKPD
jgi:DHA3 family macrolide efflux protein-like MFS transporter